MGIKRMGMGVKTWELSPETANSLLFLTSYISFRWEWEWDGNGNEVIEIGGNWYEKSVPAHLYPEAAAPPLWRREPATRSQSAYGERKRRPHNGFNNKVVKVITVSDLVYTTQGGYIFYAGGSIAGISCRRLLLLP